MNTLRSEGSQSHPCIGLYIHAAVHGGITTSGVRSSDHSHLEALRLLQASLSGAPSVRGPMSAAHLHGEGQPRRDQQRLRRPPKCMRELAHELRPYAVPSAGQGLGFKFRV
jgi:hypothetical protein